MTKFEDLDITSGFVLDQDDAIAYLNSIALEHVREIMDGYEDSEGIDAILEDLRSMRETVEQKDWEYIKFEYHPMAASQIIIKEMKEN